MKFLVSPLIVALAASAAWPAGYRGSARPAAAHFTAAHLRAAPVRSFASGSSFQGRSSFAAHPLRGTPFGGRSTFASSLRSGRGFSRGLTATPVTPSQPSASGGSAESTGGATAAGPFVGTANNTLVESPGDARTMTTDGGGLISFNPAPSAYITSAPGAFVGQADKAPTPNPTWGAAAGGASGLNAITPNSPITQ